MKESLIDIVNEINNCDKARRGTRVYKVATALDTEVKVEVKPYHKPDKDKLHCTMMAIGKFANRHGLSRKAAAAIS